MTATINASTTAGVVTTADTSGILQLQTNGTAALTVDASQNVGIGITSPTRKLAVSGTWTNTGDYLMDSGSPQLAWTSGDLRFKTGGLSGTEVVRIDSSGNVGIGTSSPIAKLHLSTASASAAVLILNSSNNTPYMRFDESNAAKFTIGESSTVGGGGTGFYDLYAGTSVGQRFFTGAAERMRIDSSGRIQMNTTAPKYSATLTIVKGGNSYNITSSVTATSSQGHMVFENNSADAVGSIFTSGSATQYNTSSDYRLKENIAPMTGALAKVALLKPCTYKWKVDGSDGQGFIAHELAEVEAGCVTGEKDAVDAEGNPQYQGIDTSFLVATLTAALQELKAIVDAQGAEIAALKGATA